MINNKLKGLNVNITNTTNNDLETIWIKIPYLADKGHQLSKSLKAKLKHHFTKAFYKSWGFTPTWKIRYPNWCNPMLFTSLIVQVVMIVTLEKQCNLCTRTEEHARSDEGSAIYDHIKNCSCYSYIENLSCFNNDSFDKALFSIHSVQSNTKIIDSTFNWNILLIKEALLIKQLKNI